MAGGKLSNEKLELLSEIAINVDEKLSSLSVTGKVQKIQQGNA